MEILLKDGVRYIPFNFETESHFEKTVFAQYKFLFGENAILFDKQKIRTETGIGTIPDAFVISPGKRKWYIIEVELSVHDVYQHIIPQMIKFKNAISNDRSRRELAKAFDKSIDEDITKLASWIKSTNDRNVHRILSEIVDQDPLLIIIIDNHKKELENSINNLPFKTKINIFKTFCREGFGLGDNIYQFEVFEDLAKAKPITQAQNELNIKSQNKIKGIQNRIKAPSPSASEWAKQIPELASLPGLNSWAAVCDHLNIYHEGRSARREIQSWVRKNKPFWAQVPDA